MMMMTPSLFIAAYALDWLVGDPAWLPHPVHWMGRMIRGGEKLLRGFMRGPRGEFVGGLLLMAITVGAFGAGSWYVLLLLKSWNPAVEFAVSLYLAMTTLATRSLLDEASGVRCFLAGNKLISARRQVARIVGRDTHDLDEPGVARAAIETLAESASDGIIAPMLYLAVGGVPAALAYKAINTLDSMIGHRDERYEFFGKCTARLDDAANLIPARLTGLLFIVSAWSLSLDWRGAWRIMRRDGAKHKSPNAGRPEAAMAGALGVRLGGTNYYDGEPHVGHHLGDARSPLDVRALQNALRLTARVSLLMFALFLSACLLVPCW
ncbi:MAG TPA: adenosylcobinamide-phosphate synthase CbiB [Blastocatellia bacterium]|jgi:adenosylcobinamide-phosphate synthase